MSEKLYDDDYNADGESVTGQAGKRQFIKFKDGETVVRILPPLKAWAEHFGGKPSPFFHLHKHAYSHPDNEKGFVSYVCPKKASGGARQCDDCDESFSLRQTGDDADKEMARLLGAKHVVYVNVIDRNDEGAGPKVMELSAPISEKFAKGRSKFEMLMEVMKSKRNPKNLIHPLDGFDLIITRSGKGQFGTSYKFEGDSRPTPLSADEAQMEKWISEQHDLREMIQAPSDEQIAALKERALNFGAQRRSTSRGGTRDEGGSGVQDQIEDAAGNDDVEDLDF